MKAIETRYKGYRFRSRLEARWAVFFDALAMDWTYEPEGFELADGTRYLPDFYIPSMGLYVEVKGSSPTTIEAAKCERLAFETGAAVLLTHGLPCEHPSLLYCWDTTDTGAGGFWSGYVTMEFWEQAAPSAVVHDDAILTHGRALFLDVACRHWLETSFAPFHPSQARQQYAADAARAARFEHGKTPK